LKQTLRQILDEFGTDLKEDLQKEMIAKGITSNGQDSRLGASLRFYYGENNGEPVFKLAGADYLEAVDNGREKEKKPAPVPAIFDWMKRKGIKPTPEDTSKLSFRQIGNRQKKISVINNIKNKSIKKAAKVKVRQRDAKKAQLGMAIAISKSIGKHGTIKRFDYHGADFMDKVVNSGRVQQLQVKISAFLKQDIAIEITKDFR
jgi:hypothetical protein